MLTDIEIAKSVKMRPINEVAAELGIHEDQVENYGRYIAKITTDKIDTNKFKNHHLILVTAISPTKAGNGKTTVSVGLALGMQKIGKKAVVALREPSLGPCFGMKGGAAGGGYAQVLPMDKINLHFTGDFHAITEANNMISALLDNYRFQHEAEGFKLKKILWRRVMDVNDRGLRRIITGIGDKNGIETESGFDITPASEIMAIMCFATSIDDLRRRIDNILRGRQAIYRKGYGCRWQYRSSPSRCFEAKSGSDNRGNTSICSLWSFCQHCSWLQFRHGYSCCS